MIPQFALTQGYSISRILKGGWQLAGGHGQTDREAAIYDMLAFVEKGITTVDCADIYTGVEAMIGEFLRRYESTYGQEAGQKLQIHTKFVPDRDKLSTLTKGDAEAIIDRSLKRIGRDQLDLVQFHWWDYAIPRYVETALMLQDLKRRGKIRNLAVTNFDVPHLKEIISAGIELVSAQVQYSVLDHRPEKTMAEFAEKHHIYLICYGTIAGGFLSEQYLGQAEPRAPMENRSLTKYKLIIDDLGGWQYFQTLLQVLHSIASKHNTSIANVATRYILEQPQVAAVVIGARNTSHLDDMLQAFDLELDGEDSYTLQAIFKQAATLEGDIYYLERIKAGRHARIMQYNLNKASEKHPNEHSR